MHAHFMAWSYVGLIAATVAEIVSRVPGIDFGWSALLSSSVVILIRLFAVPITVAKALKPLARISSRSRTPPLVTVPTQPSAL